MVWVPHNKKGRPMAHLLFNLGGVIGVEPLTSYMPRHWLSLLLLWFIEYEVTMMCPTPEWTSWFLDARHFKCSLSARKKEINFCHGSPRAVFETTLNWTGLLLCPLHCAYLRHGTRTHFCNWFGNCNFLFILFYSRPTGRRKKAKWISFIGRCRLRRTWKL